MRYPVVIEETPGFFMVGDFSQGYGFGAEIIGGAVRVLDCALGGVVFGGDGRRDGWRALAATPSH
jgi:succinate dehydrogenase/fumarate reductase flavoprotein subunit